METDQATGVLLRRHKPAPSAVSRDLSTRKRCRCRCIISYNAKFKVVWDWIVLLLVIFTAIQIPYMAAFPSAMSTASINASLFNGHPITTTVLLGLVVDLMFVLDIVINFRTTYLKGDSDEVVSSPKRIAFHYLKTWFCVDFLAALPFDWFISSGPNQKDETATLIGLLKSARLLRLFRVARKLDRYSEYGIAVLFLLMCLFTLIGHWLACVWHVVGDAGSTDPNGWVYKFKMDNLLSNATDVHSDVFSRKKYISALYFVMTSLTSVGFGNVAANTEPEQIFTILVMLLGALMYACIFGNMVAIVQRLYLKTSKFHLEMNTVKEFVKFYKFSDQLKHTIQTHSRHEWTISDGVSCDKVLQRFPESLQADICYEIYNELLATIPCMSHASIGCMRTLARRFKTSHLQSGHFALRQGDEVQGVYVLETGSVEIIHGDVKIGELYEISLFGYNFTKKLRIPKANASIRAASTVKIHFISKTDMLHVLRFYPQFAHQFKKSFHPRYEICDEVEEGQRRTQMRRKPKNSSVAKSMMKLSFGSKSGKSRSQHLDTQNSLNGSSMIGVPETHPRCQSPLPSLELNNTTLEMSELNLLPWQLPGGNETDDSEDTGSSWRENVRLKAEIDSLKEQLTHVNQTLDDLKGSLEKKLEIILHKIGGQDTLENNIPTSRLTSRNIGNNMSSTSF